MTPEKQAAAIAFLNDEIRSLRLAPTINGCDMKPEWEDMLEIMQTCLEALKVCSVDTNKTSPLTLERLREMDGQPVWVERNESPHDGKWFIVDHADVENPDKTLYTREGVTYSDYGKYFTAYAYPPAHIGRDAFGCQFCNGKFCGNCLYDALPLRIEPCRSCESHSKWETDYRFCPHCGRPLTPEAWAELEKRLRG